MVKESEEKPSTARELLHTLARARAIPASAFNHPSRSTSLGKNIEQNTIHHPPRSVRRNPLLETTRDGQFHEGYLDSEERGFAALELSIPAQRIEHLDYQGWIDVLEGNKKSLLYLAKDPNDLRGCYIVNVARQGVELRFIDGGDNETIPIGRSKDWLQGVGWPKPGSRLMQKR